MYDICVDHSLYQANLFSINHDNFSDRVSQFNQYANENVAMFINSSIKTDQEIGNQFMNQWKNSPGHDANMKATQPNSGASGALEINKLGSSMMRIATMINVKV